jgi:pSer/pThr/pTyr-binding forkhead associated (FHA) protein
MKRKRHEEEYLPGYEINRDKHFSLKSPGVDEDDTTKDRRRERSTSLESGELSDDGGVESDQAISSSGLELGEIMDNDVHYKTNKSNKKDNTYVSQEYEYDPTPTVSAVATTLSWQLLDNGTYWCNEKQVLYDPASGFSWLWDDALKTYIPYSKEVPISSASMKLVVIESAVVDIGNLVLVDGAGLSVGRDKLNESSSRRLRLPELPVSRHHCNIYLDKTPSESNDDGDGFFIVDNGSTHGTEVNGERLSEAKSSSLPWLLKHLDLVKIGSTVLEVHQHQQWSCEKCMVRDNNVLELSAPREKAPPDKPRSNQPVRLSHKEELAYLKRKALGASKSKNDEESASAQYNDALTTKMTNDYVDRAAMRRKKYGNINEMDVFEFRGLNSTEVSTHQLQQVEHHPVAGVGESLLKKLGWKAGTGLGRGQSGICEPVKAIGTDGRKGLGSLEDDRYR